MPELRRHHRTPIDISVEFGLIGAAARSHGRATDVSLGGMFIRTKEPLPFSTNLVVYISFPREKTPLALHGVVRWTRSDGMGVQFGLLGARETHAITELTKSGARAGAI